MVEMFQGCVGVGGGIEACERSDGDGEAGFGS